MNYNVVNVANIIPAHNVSYVQRFPPLGTNPDFIDYVRNLDQAVVDRELSPEVIKQSDFYPYNPRLLETDAEKFRSGDFDLRIQYLGNLLNVLPSYLFEQYTPTDAIRNLERLDIKPAIPGLYTSNRYPRSFMDLASTLEFWASNFLVPFRENAGNYNVSSPLYIEIVMTTPRFVLDLLCRAIMPAMLYNMVSKTELALAFALLTGKVIEPTYDPTANKQTWSIVTNLDTDIIVELISLSHRLEDHLPNMRRPDVFGNMLFVSDPRIMILIPYAQAMKIYSQKYGDARLPPELRAKFSSRDAFFTAIGFNPIYYDDILGPLKSIKIFDAAGYIIHKEFGIPRPPLLYSVPSFAREHEITEAAVWYNDDELIQFYVPNYHARTQAGRSNYKYPSRNNMLNYIRRNYNEENFEWKIATERIRGVSCANGENVSLMYGGRRSEDIEESTDVELGTNPVLTYGTPIVGGKVRCFRTSELIAVFENALETPDNVDFPDPDYINPGPGRPHVIDPLTNRRLLRTFNERQMNNLRTVLTYHTRGAPPMDHRGQPNLLIQLLELVRRIFNIRFPNAQGNEADSVSLDQAAVILAQNPAWRNDLLLFFSWLFMFSMWMRFWKGPGYPFNIGQVAASSDKCPAIQRDEHIIIELSVYSNIMFDLERNNTELSDFIKGLNLLSYEWDTKRVSSAKTTIVNVIDLIQSEKYCMGFAGDNLLGTAYYYLVNFLKVPENRVRDLITYSFKLLRERERSVIRTRKQMLEGTRPTDASHRLWVQQGLETIRSHELLLQVGESGELGGYQLPEIDFSKVGHNMHV